MLGMKVLSIEGIMEPKIVLENIKLPKGIYMVELKGLNTQIGKMVINE